MKHGKAEILDVRVYPGNVLLVTCAGPEDAAIFARLMIEGCAVGTVVEIHGTDVWCKPPRPVQAAGNGGGQTP